MKQKLAPSVACAIHLHRLMSICQDPSELLIFSRYQLAKMLQYTYIYMPSLQFSRTVAMLTGAGGPSGGDGELLLTADAGHHREGRLQLRL